MRIKRFYPDHRAEFIAEDKIDAGKKEGDIIRLDDYYYQIQKKYYSGQGYLFVVSEIDLTDIPNANTPF